MKKRSTKLFCLFTAFLMFALSLSSIANAAETRPLYIGLYDPGEATGNEEVKPTVTEIAPNVWCISEFYLVNAYLVVGEERAALFDTTCGVTNLREIVSGITDKPVDVFLTHGHADHTAGLWQFTDSTFYLHPADLGLGAPGNSFRTSYIETRGPVRFPGEGHQEAMLAQVPNPEPAPVELSNSKPVVEGDTFNLGGVTISTYETPGHTAGSVCYLVEPQRVLISGDTINNSIILRRQPDNDMKLIADYNATVKKLWALSDKYDILAVGHEGFYWDKQLVKDYVDLTDGLLNGSIVGQYEEYGIRAGDVARLGLAELWYQCDK